MKNIIAAAVLSLSVLPAVVQAAPTSEIDRNHQCELMRVGSISASGGTIAELTHQLAAQAEGRGADYFRITHLNTDKTGYATATLYDNADGQV